MLFVCGSSIICRWFRDCYVSLNATQREALVSPERILLFVSIIFTVYVGAWVWNVTVGGCTQGPSALFYVPNNNTLLFLFWSTVKLSSLARGVVLFLEIYCDFI